MLFGITASKKKNTVEDSLSQNKKKHAPFLFIIILCFVMKALLHG